MSVWIKCPYVSICFLFCFCFLLIWPKKKKKVHNSELCCTVACNKTWQWQYVAGIRKTQSILHKASVLVQISEVMILLMMHSCETLSSTHAEKKIFKLTRDRQEVKGNHLWHSKSKDILDLFHHEITSPHINNSKAKNVGGNIWASCSLTDRKDWNDFRESRIKGGQLKVRGMDGGCSHPQAA